MRLDKTA